MLLFTLLLVLCSYPIRTALVSDPPTFSERLDKLYEKIDKLNTKLDETTDSKLYEKLDKLNSLSPDSDLNEEDEELLHNIQMWGMLSDEQLTDVETDLRTLKHSENEKSGSEKSEVDPDYEWNDEEPQDDDYAMDEWEVEDEESNNSSQKIFADVTPAPIIRETRRNMISAAEHIDATKARPRILDDSGLTAKEHTQLRTAVYNNIKSALRVGQCRTPQPRWLTVRKLAPAADIVYLPPCVLLHRCDADCGCCHSESDMCAPVDGKFVSIPFYLNSGQNLSAKRMLFYNHTRCACVSRATLSAYEDFRPERHRLSGRQAVRAEVKEVRNEVKDSWKTPTEEPQLERDEEPMATAQVRRCTCPTLFLGKMSENVCSCICDWKEYGRRRECLSLARGREHFGLRDRVCVANGDCTAPSCEYGAYDRKRGRCPQRIRRIRYYTRGSA